MNGSPRLNGDADYMNARDFIHAVTGRRLDAPGAATAPRGPDPLRPSTWSFAEVRDYGRTHGPKALQKLMQDENTLIAREFHDQKYRAG